MSVALSRIFEDHFADLNLIPYQKKIIKKIINCQTPAMGYHKIKCSNDKCSNEEIIFNSCKSIYCPKCQNFYQIKWSADRMGELLPVEYMHIVFSIPTCLRPLLQYNPKRGLNALSYAAKKALNNTFAKDKSQIGVISVIHTTTQLLDYAPHIHCLIPKGYLNSDKTKWIQIKKDIKTFHEKLSVQFKINFLKELKRNNDELSLKLPEESTVKNVESIIEDGKKCKFKVYLQDNVEDINHTLKYLGDKTKKVVINSQKIVSYKDTTVTVSVSDRKEKNKIKEKDIDSLLFLKRFILHILPSRFTRIRYYGFLSNSCKKRCIELCRSLIEKAKIITKKVESKARKIIFDLIKKITTPTVCPVCHKGFLVLDGL